MKEKEWNRTPVIPEMDKRFEYLRKWKETHANQFKKLPLNTSMTVLHRLMKDTQHQEAPIDIELPKGIQDVIERQEQITQSTLNPTILKQIESIQQFFEPMWSTIRTVREVVSQPHIIEAVKNMQKTLQVVGDVTREDDRLKKYSNENIFWTNVSKVSEELVILPIGLPEEVLDYLCQKTCDAEEVRRMIGAFDAMDLKGTLEDGEHNDYMFNGYLKKILELHHDHPEHYQISIPALFVIIEGTLGQIFKISEDGTAVEIKQKMNVFWDIYSYVYANQFIGSAFAFWSRFFLANTKGIFNQLTVSSNEAGIKINRNAILHGKSNPDDWTIEDFETLLNLLRTTLFLRETADILTKEFDAMIYDEFYEKRTLVLKEFEKAIPKKTKKGEPRQYRAGDINTLRDQLKKDLNHIFNYDEEKQEYILKKSNFPKIEKRLLSLNQKPGTTTS